MPARTDTPAEGGGGADAAHNPVTRLAVGSAAVLIPLVFVTLRVIRVAHGDYSTELALINNGKALTIIVGSLAPVVPYFATYIAIAIIFRILSPRWAGDAHRRGQGPRRARASLRSTADADARNDFDTAFIYLAIGLAVIFVVVFVTAVDNLLNAAVSVLILLAVFEVLYLGIWRIASANHASRDSKKAARAALPTVLTAALAAFVIYQLGTDDNVWLPPEVVTMAGQARVVYPLGDAGAGTTLAMNDSDRSLVILTDTEVASARACYDSHRADRLLGATLFSGRSLSQIIQDQSKSHGPSCASLVAGRPG